MVEKQTIALALRNQVHRNTNTFTVFAITVLERDIHHVELNGKVLRVALAF